MDTSENFSSWKPSFQAMNPQYHQRPYCVQVYHTPTQGETSPFRHARVKQHLHYIPEDGVNTVWNLVRRAAHFGNHRALGYRKGISTHLREGVEDSDGNKEQLRIPQLNIAG